MSRQPITTYVGGKGPRQQIWEAIRGLAGINDGTFTVDDISRQAKIETHPTRDYLKCLAAAGYIRLTNTPDRCVKSIYEMTRDNGVEAPRVRKDGTPVTQGMAQEQMWRALRLLNVDTNTRELVAHASTPAIPVAASAANDYLQWLHAAGYLVCTAPGKGGVQARYRLLPSRNTGPRPPMICRTKIVYDPNEDKVVYQPHVTEEDVVYGK